MANLTAHGAQRLAWGVPWDDVLVLSLPGAVTVYAFAEAGPRDELRARLDSLAGLLSRANLGGSLPVHLVVVTAGAGSIFAKERRQLTQLSPPTYFPGIRPAALTVDLGTGQVSGGGLLRKPEGIELIQQAASTTPEVILPADMAGAESQRALHTARMQAFYRLMAGRQPVATYGLIAINVAIFLLSYLVGSPDSDSTLLRMGALQPVLIEQGEWWRLFTAMFLHAGVPHILFNMLSLFAIGTLAERLYGSVRFVAIYLGAGLIGSLASFGFAVLTGNLGEIGVGASGAIFGVAGALLTVRFQPSEVIPRQLRERVSNSLLPLVIISLVFAYLTPHVDNAAHVGGLLGGMALSFIFPLTRRLAAVE